MAVLDTLTNKTIPVTGTYSGNFAHEYLLIGGRQRHPGPIQLDSARRPRSARRVFLPVEATGQQRDSYCFVKFGVPSAEEARAKFDEANRTQVGGHVALR